MLTFCYFTTSNPFVKHSIETTAAMASFTAHRALLVAPCSSGKLAVASVPRRTPTMICQVQRLPHSRAAAVSEATGPIDPDRIATVPDNPPPGMPSCLCRVQSDINSNVMVLQFPVSEDFPELSGSRAVMLDNSGHIHSLYFEDKPITGGLVW